MYDKVVLTWHNMHKDVRQRARILCDGTIVYKYKDSEWGNVIVVIDTDGTQHIHTYHSTKGNTTQ